MANGNSNGSGFMNLQNLATGSSGLVAQTNPVIVVQDGNGVNNGCLPCNEGVICEVGQTQGVNLDLSRFTAANQVVRFRVDTRSSTDGGLANRNMVFFTGLHFGEWADNFPRLVAAFPGALLGGTSVHNGDLLNGAPAGNAMGEFNVSGVAGGAVASNEKIQYDAVTFPQNSGIEISSFFLPPDPSDSVVIHQELTPLCDFCSTNNNGNFTTHSYTSSLPITERNGIVVFIPGATGGTLFTLDICFGSNGFPNHVQDTWAHQEIGG